MNECPTNTNNGLHKYRTRHTIETKAKKEVCVYCKEVKHKQPVECLYYGSGVRGNEITIW